MKLALAVVAIAVVMIMGRWGLASEFLTFSEDDDEVLPAETPVQEFVVKKSFRVRAHSHEACFTEGREILEAYRFGDSPACVYCCLTVHFGEEKSSSGHLIRVKDPIHLSIKPDEKGVVHNSWCTSSDTKDRRADTKDRRAWVNFWLTGSKYINAVECHGENQKKGKRYPELTLPLAQRAFGEFIEIVPAKPEEIDLEQEK